MFFFCTRIENDPSKHALFGFGSISSECCLSIQWLFVEFNLFWSHLGAISCMTLRHRVSYLSLTLPGVQDKYSNLQKHAAAVSRFQRVQEPYLDFFDLRHLLVPRVFRWTSSEGLVGKTEDPHQSFTVFSCHILENMGPKAFVFFLVKRQGVHISFVRSAWHLADLADDEWRHKIEDALNTSGEAVVQFGVLSEASFSFHIFQLRWNWIALLQSKWCSNSMVQNDLLNGSDRD